MKRTILLILCHLPAALFCQEVIEGKWTMECGASTISSFKNYGSINLRYISPRFKISNDDWTEEMEAHPEKYKRARLMLELIYRPPLNVLCTGFNVQYRLLKFKKLTLEVYGGLKFYLIAAPDLFVKPEYVRPTERSVWFFNEGLILQLNLGVIAPFADLSYDGMITIGTELDLHAIYKRPKGRYRLKTPKT